MKDEDLRIGNIVWVIYEGGNIEGTKNPKYMKITGITYDSLYFNELINEDDLEYSQTLPLKLTDDVMKCTNLRAAPIDVYKYELPQNGNVSFEVWDNDSVMCYIGNAMEVKIKYLHQLQNLYFSLTGKELKIDINKLNNLK